MLWICESVDNGVIAASSLLGLFFVATVTRRSKLSISTSVRDYKVNDF